MSQKFTKVYQYLKNDKNFKFYVILLVVFATYGNFSRNQYHVAPTNFFNFLRQDSERLVLDKILIDTKYHNGESVQYKNSNLYGLGWVGDDKFYGYTAQIGLQGHIYSILLHKIGLSIKNLKRIVTLASVIVLMILSYLLGKTLNFQFAIVLFLSFFYSPWIVGFAGNLYWLMFLWFLPAVFIFMVFIDIDKSRKNIWLAGFTIVIFIKSLCGYEYLSTIVLFSLAIFFIAPFLEEKPLTKVRSIKYIILIFSLALLGFSLAILIHAYLRGEGNLLLGLKSIYEKDVLRRTLMGDTTRFNPELDGFRLHDSLNSSIFEVLKIYILGWYDDLLKNISSHNFKFLILLNIYIIFFSTEMLQKKKLNMAIFIVYLAVPLSWFILGKSHSFIHTGHNFVLWYLGFVGVLFYIPIQYIYNFCVRCLREINETNP
ncbi:hypothetical protein P0082_02830 [Candidatus Haliotispira prima]|uniref:Glycosyltransferase RgtA/B/C/D-like domain-containing protein n=1 Tax=Candidatus Haliotispira prima TaxID=3034016 RepID=A0ABY8MIJ4_9SPIO|nr:hypothetical protein P0082_02830 [Candidatus Haliotispira prima]